MYYVHHGFHLTSGRHTYPRLRQWIHLCVCVWKYIHWCPATIQQNSKQVLGFQRWNFFETQNYLVFNSTHYEKYADSHMESFPQGWLDPLKPPPPCVKKVTYHCEKTRLAQKPPLHPPLPRHHGVHWTCRAGSLMIDPSTETWSPTFNFNPCFGKNIHPSIATHPWKLTAGT